MEEGRLYLGENRTGIIHSVPGSLFLNIFKIDKRAEKSHNNCLGAIETSVTENVERLWDLIALLPCIEYSEVSITL